jgi:Linear amide C-N hydrolases, choloylglycine hydrolase family
VKRPALLAVVALLLAAGCTAPAPQAQQGASRQTKEQQELTLASKRQVDGALPLFEMTYHGDYDPLAGVEPPRAAHAFGCSLFVTAGLFGRNFDWERHPAMVLLTRPPGRYASLSMVDMAYLQDRPLDAPLLPFDGLNEKGLAVGLAADESGRAGHDPAKRTVGGVRVLRLILDNAAGVDEALKVLGEYNLDFTGGPPLHYLFADASGASAVVEFVDGQMRVERGGPPGSPWQALTNFRLVGAPQGVRQQDLRYRTASTALRAGEVTDLQAAHRVLRSVAQGHTRWSVVYDLTKGEMHLVVGQQWDTGYLYTLRG